MFWGPNHIVTNKLHIFGFCFCPTGMKPFLEKQQCSPVKWSKIKRMVLSHCASFRKLINRKAFSPPTCTQETIPKHNEDQTDLENKAYVDVNKS